MKTSKATAIAVAAALLGGCMPLSQAALVYTSKIQVGVNVTAATPESPGVELHLGVNAIDAAYVPVSVARPCPTASDSGCPEREFPIAQIRGLNSRTNTESVSQIALEDAQRELQTRQSEAEALQNQADASQSVIRSTTERLTTLTAQRERLRAAPAIVDATTPAPAPNALTEAELTASINELTSLRDSEQRKFTGLQAQFEGARAMQVSAAANVDRLRAARDQARGNDKNDALSVFGTFENNSTGSASVSTTSGTTGGAGIRLGKVFSTGVASQNLTEGIADSARASAMAQCLQQVRETAASETDPAQRREMIRNLVGSCATATTAPN